MDPKDFLTLAQQLANESTPLPEKLRTATSRAYYAAYNVSVDALGRLGIKISKSHGGHGELIKYLGNSKDRDLEAISGQLGTLQTNRNHADYHLDYRDAEKSGNVKAHVAQAQRVIETVERCCGGPNRPRILQAMKDFEAIMKGRTGS